MKYLIYTLLVVAFVSVVSVGGIIFVGLEYQASQERLFKQGLASKEFLYQERTELKQELSFSQERIESLEKKLERSEDNFEDLADEVEDALGTVAVLQKLKETDEELLQKYSRVYFLNEHYVPERLSEIDEDFSYGGKSLEIKREVLPFLEELLEEAEDDDIDLRIISAYRSFNTQTSIKQSYVTTYGTTAANTFSADQGFSEHQLGTTVDFTTDDIGSSLSRFKDTDAYEWLEDNAYRYGFVLSYPEDNSYYISEPWHWRFVGKELAKDLDRKNKGLYDLDQRELNEYLVDIFED